jgi:hypothetical protein
MEQAIYTEAIARLKSADALAYYTDQDVVAPETYEWYQNQIEQALTPNGEDNKTVPFDFPAIFFEFGTTEFEKGDTVRQEAKGTLTLHVAQLTFVEGREGAVDHDDFKALLDYANVIADLLSGQMLGCSAKLILASIERDHTNRSIMTDKIRFTWTGKRKRAAVPVIP